MSVDQPVASPFSPVARQPDLPALERQVLELWQERQTFQRLRAQNAGNERWSFLDGPITANNPMGVHHAWGRTYKDLFQRFRAMLGHDQRWQNGFDCQGLWVEVNVERELGFTSKRDIESFGIGEFVSLCKQRVLTYAALQTEQSIRLGMWMDWNDPAELRRLRDLLAEDPAQQVTVEGPEGPVTDSVEMIVGRLGMPELGGSYFTFSNENNDLIWGFLAECHRRGWLYKGFDSMPWCTRCGTGISQMEMNEGYAEREDPGLTVRFPLVDRPGEWLLVWTTTPWTLSANVAAAVGPDLAYVKVRQGGDLYWLAKGTLNTALRGEFDVLEEVRGSELVSWRYGGPFDDLPAVGAAFAGAGEDGADYEHRVIPWDEVGEDEGTGIVHIAPGAGAEDYQLGKSLGLPVIAPLSEDGHYLDSFGPLAGLDAHAVAPRIVETLEQRGLFYHLEPYTHRYPHCWRCGTALLFRVVDEWYIDMGPVYDQPRESLSREQIDASLRYQIMEVVDRIRWIPGFGYERELDWLRTMSDWMISKKRYWGLALPIWECASCGGFDVISGRDELRQRAVAGWDEFEGHTPHRPHVDAVHISCPHCGQQAERIRDVGNPWLDAGIVPFSTMHYRTDEDYWRQWFPADFITESFPGQFRNWFYSMLAMSTVLRREPPFRNILGFATLFGEDGRPMHKSWGNAIEFNEGAERIGVDVMRWMFSRARPEDNILFGYGTADEARRELLILWNVFAFFATYARLAGWRPTEAQPAPPTEQVLDRWILSRVARTGEAVRQALADYDSRAGALRLSTLIDDLSTWYLRRSRRRLSRNDDQADRDAAFGVLHLALVATTRLLAPMLPFLAEHLYQQLVVEPGVDAPDSVHLTSWPDSELAGHRDPELESAMATVRRAVELSRTLRGQAGLRLRQPLRQMWLALPGGRLGADTAVERALLDLLRDEVNVRRIELIGDESELVERRVKPLLPVLGPRLGADIPKVMAAARANDVEYLPGGGVRLAGIELAPEEVEILATPRPGTAVAHDDGLVVVIDTEIDDDLRAEGDARELIRAVQDLRKQAGLELDEQIDLWLVGPTDLLRSLEPFLGRLADDTLAARIHHDEPPAGSVRADQELVTGRIGLSLAPVSTAGR
ncbi:MAG TPA: class I tRNA ligase family protein [Candidatus Limnocylindrales bacterium]|nr:class I tRNA ligase family protein [Candidatus Limnocylindrales bacterium]